MVYVMVGGMVKLVFVSCFFLLVFELLILFVSVFLFFIFVVKGYRVIVIGNNFFFQKKFGIEGKGEENGEFYYLELNVSGIEMFFFVLMFLKDEY